MEKKFWSDKLAEDIVNRKKYNYLNKKVKKTTSYAIKSSTSISGVPHIGNASDVIRHDAVVRSLRDMGKKVRFIWVAEDMDAFRKVPAGIPPSFKKYLGMPVVDVPCPDGCCKNYSEHFSNLFIDSLKDFGTYPEKLSTAFHYRSGKFYEWIKKVLENIDKIREIWNKSRTMPLPENWNPWKPVCENCGKLMTTRVVDMNGNNVSYVCEDYSFKPFGEKAYTKLKGCGHEGESDIKKGNGKLLWRVEWAMLWDFWKINLEGAGKEHFMPSGSFWTAGEICEKIFDWPEPYPSKNPLQPYEYLTIDGKKMSASVGNVVSTWDWPSFAPPQVLRLIFLKRMKTVRDFSYSKIPEYVDEYDKLQRIYFGEGSSEKNQLKRLYEMIETTMPKKLPQQVPFYFAAMISQICEPRKQLERAIELLKFTGHIKGSLTKEDKSFIEKRLLIAKNWAKRYAPENMKIEVSKEFTADAISSLSKNEKNAVLSLVKKLKQDITERDLQSAVYDIARENSLQPRDFFKLMYKLLLGRESGPRLGPFIVAVGKQRVIKLLEKIE